MAVTASTVAAAATMLAAVAAIFLSFVLCFYICLCAKRSSARASSPPPPPGSGVLAHLRYLFCGSSSPATTDSSSPSSGAALWFYDGGLDDASMASLPKKEVSKGDAATDCAVCITELAPGDTARVLPRCGHGFHVDCVDMWLKSHSTCPLCRRAVVDEKVVVVVQQPEADPESPNFPTNVLFFGSSAQSQAAATTSGATDPRAPPQPAQGPIAGVAAVVEAARAAAFRRLLGRRQTVTPPIPPPQADRDMEIGRLDGGEGCSHCHVPTKPQPGS